MFKRVERKRKRKEEEEALGLDEDIKEVLGMHDTDSDESQSEPEDDWDDEEQDSELEADDDDDEEENSEGIVDSDDGGDDDPVNLYPPIPIAKALVDAVFHLSEDPPISGCLVCPGKLFKSEEILQQHKISKAHERRFKRFKTLCKDEDEDTNAWDIVEKMGVGGNSVQQSKPEGDGLSKRKARKREYHKNRQAKRKAAVIAKKEKAKSKAAKDGETVKPASDDSTKPAKKQKTETSGKQKREKTKETLPPKPAKKQKTDKQIKTETETKGSLPSESPKPAKKQKTDLKTQSKTGRESRTKVASSKKKVRAPSA